jgi:hypothetical protein
LLEARPREELRMKYLAGALVFLIPIVALIAGVVTTWIRAKHGLLETTDTLTKKLEAELAERDARIAAQEERIRVLERIATDESAGRIREFERL